MADQLGLTVAGAARNRWSWPPASAATVTPLRPAVSSVRPTARDRFRRTPLDAGPANTRTTPDNKETSA